MMKALHLIPWVVAVLASAPAAAKGPSPGTDAGIRQAIIDESIAAYPGNCPCPYHLARNGSRCGKRSAYSRVGGHAPLCYPEDVTEEMVRAYRARRMR